MVTARKVHPLDLDFLRKIDTEGIVNYLVDPFTFDSVVVLDDDGILGVGMNRVINEFKIVVDPALSNLTKARAILGLYEEGIKVAKSNEIIAEITQGGDQFIKSLEKHFGFHKAEGTLVRRFR